ncbi:MAG: hypothetical protein ACYTKD_27480 [Planctomycetota bacterium]|jgi:hypothetical protein
MSADRRRNAVAAVALILAGIVASSSCVERPAPEAPAKPPAPRRADVDAATARSAPAPTETAAPAPDEPAPEPPLADGPETAVEIARAEVAGMSQFRAHWDAPLVLSEDAPVRVWDKKLTDRGGTAEWKAGAEANPICFDALNRMLLVRFPDSAERIAREVRAGKAVKRLEVVLPFVDEELWPPGRPDWPGPENYAYRMNWNVDRMWRAHRPKWHAVAWALRRPWHADPDTGPTLNASVAGAVYWKEWGARDVEHDRYPKRFGPTPVNHADLQGRMDVTSLVQSPTYGRTLAERLRRFADCGLLVRKWEAYDHHYFNGCYEWGTATGGRAIRIAQPKLVATFVAASASGRARMGELAPPPTSRRSRQSTRRPARAARPPLRCLPTTSSRGGRAKRSRNRAGCRKARGPA